MDVTEKINVILAEFATGCGLSSAELDTDGVLSLSFDDKLKATFVYLPERDKLIMEVDVANPKELGQGIFQQLVSFNRHWYQFDLHFGFDEETQKIQLYRQLSASHVTRDSFEQSLAEILDHAEFWQDLFLAPAETLIVADASSMRV